MKLSVLLAYLKFYKVENEGNPDLTSIEMDHREVKEGSLFVCIKGAKFDSHQFVDAAVANGAKAIIATQPITSTVPVVYVKDARRVLPILADAFYTHPTKQLHLVGVTGTNGKTTVSHLVETVFQQHGINTGVIGTIGMKFNGQILDVNNTTPESPVLQRTFRQMVDEKVDAAVMEVSSHALDMGRVRGCDFNIGIFTNLTQDHLDYHQTMDEYQKAKGLLFSQLGNTYDSKSLKFAVLNGDDPASKYYEKITSVQCLTFGIDTPCDVMAENIKITNQGTSFTLITPHQSKQMNIKLVGKFSVYNVLAAIATGLVSDIPLEVIIEALEAAPGVPGRFELVDAGQPYSVIVDYAHTPDSLENALKTVNEFAKGKVFVVIGCGGDRDKTKRPIMAEIAVKHADTAILTSDNPRTEDPIAILKDMENGITNGKYKTIVDRKKAIEYAVEHASENDVILIAGKGHETYQIIGTETFEFDDRNITRLAIEKIQKGLSS
jgi:UDP-N-acetylmuramoyl-L-alanyl-D-glutamate--2,6-diaminopimelate ligase